MAKTYTCRDVGVDCDWRTRGETDEEVMRNIREHARTAHDMQEIPADLEEGVRAAIKDEQ
jgi:predicted small metal-binding protein